MKPFDNRVALVTGAASGIGRALAQALATRGAQVVLADIDAAANPAAAVEVVQHGGTAIALALDVRDEAAVQRLVDEVVVRFGRLDYLFNNAGLGVVGEVRDLELEHWRRVVDVNLWGTIAATHAAYRVMVQQGSGHIVNIASLAGLVGFPSNAPYAATKHALVGLSTSLRAEGEALGVKVSVVCPGFVQSNIYRASPVVNAERAKVIETIPFALMPAERAANGILDGVARNRAIVVFPGYARLMYLFRLHAGLLAPVLRKTIADFRAARCGITSSAPTRSPSP
jgi:NAD(P)-dependent dehydrogenase (short-subunit alcohol dehydrogenase family)